jgi:hypothetical protein
VTTAADIAAITELQAALLDALDRQDVAEIEAATQALSAILPSVRTGAVRADAMARDALNHALKQNDAAKTRIHFLADRNRQKIDRLAAMRAGSLDTRYKKHNFAVV